MLLFCFLLGHQPWLSLVDLTSSLAHVYVFTDGWRHYAPFESFASFPCLSLLVKLIIWWSFNDLWSCKSRDPFLHPACWSYMPCDSHAVYRPKLMFRFTLAGREIRRCFGMSYLDDVSLISSTSCRLLLKCLLALGYITFSDNIIRHFYKHSRLRSVRVADTTRVNALLLLKQIISQWLMSYSRGPWKQYGVMIMYALGSSDPHGWSQVTLQHQIYFDFCEYYSSLRLINLYSSIVVKIINLEYQPIGNFDTKSTFRSLRIISGTIPFCFGFANIGVWQNFITARTLTELKQRNWYWNM